MREFCKVLLVDDDDLMRRHFALILTREGFEVEQAINGREAIEKIEDNCPDYLITDWNMPEVDGRELCERVRAMSLPHHIHIIFVTAFAESADLIMALAAGADDYIIKPVDMRELIARMDAGTRVLKLERTLRFEASHDMLTGIPNRRTFMEMLQREIARAQRYGSALSLLFLDVDHFKTVNDTFGHATGDLVLMTLAELLRDTLRNCDVVCRYGGEEFCALLPETPLAGAVIVAERLREKIQQTPVTWQGDNSLSITSSLGVAEFKAGTAEKLIRDADLAMYDAKRNGRNQVACHSHANSVPPDAPSAPRMRTPKGESIDWTGNRSI